MAAALTSGLVAALPGAHAASAGEFGRPGDQTAIIADRLLQAYPNRDSLALIGHAARQDPFVGESSCPACLPDALDSLLQHLDWAEADLRMRSPAVIRDRIREETARDFAGDRVLPVRGWLLSETEIKLCAIASLAEPSRS